MRYFRMRLVALVAGGTDSSSCCAPELWPFLRFESVIIERSHRQMELQVVYELSDPVKPHAVGDHWSLDFVIKAARIRWTTAGTVQHGACSVYLNCIHGSHCSTIWSRSPGDRRRHQTRDRRDDHEKNDTLRHDLKQADFRCFLI